MWGLAAHSNSRTGGVVRRPGQRDVPLARTETRLVLGQTGLICFRLLENLVGARLQGGSREAHVSGKWQHSGPSPDHLTQLPGVSHCSVCPVGGALSAHIQRGAGGALSNSPLCIYFYI